MRALIPAVVFAVLVGFFAYGLRLNPGEVPSPLIGRPAPQFDLERLRAPGERIDTATLTAQPALLNVWATWCVGCRQEHETLLAIARTGEVRIFGLNYRDDRDAAVQWLDRLGDPYVASAYDPAGAVSIDWGVYGAPETFLVDAEGVVRYKHIGPLTMDVWRDELLPLIRAARGGDT